MLEPRAYLLDIEGTTTPIDFVTTVLFPFARQHMSNYFSQSLNDPVARLQLVSDCCALAEEHSGDADAPEWLDKPDPQGALPFIYWLMDRDRKSTGLKSIQGRIWEEGYRTGRLQGVVYPDVWPAVRRWKGRGAGVYIYSSGSVLAQKLIFSHLPEGDMTRLIDGYFDTATGQKRDSDSYAKIAKALDMPPGEIMFLSDVEAEVDAAKSAGFRATLVCRGPARPDSIATFDELP